MQRPYEFLCIVSGAYSDTEVTNFVSTIRAMLQEIGAQDIEAHTLGRRRLAYSLSPHINYGTYVLFTCMGVPEKMLVFQEKIRYVKGVVRNVLRVVTTRVRAPLPTFTGDVIQDRVAGKVDDATHVEIEMRTASEEPTSVTATKKTTLSQEELDKRIDKLLSEEMNVDKI